MNTSCYLYNNFVYIPTSLEIEVGFYYEHLPIDVVPVEQTEKLRETFRAAAARGNPPISRDELAVFSRNRDRPVLVAARVRSWREFERRLSGSWSIVVNRDSAKIAVYRPRRDAGWEEDDDKTIRFPAETPLDEIIDRLIAMMQEKARQ